MRVAIVHDGLFADGGAERGLREIAFSVPTADFDGAIAQGCLGSDPNRICPSRDTA
jgi:hypothetical protein